MYGFVAMWAMRLFQTFTIKTLLYSWYFLLKNAKYFIKPYDVYHIYYKNKKDFLKCICMLLVY